MHAKTQNLYRNITAGILGALLCIAGAGQAQSPFINSRETRYLGLEAQKVFFKSAEGLSFLNGALHLSGQVPLAQGLLLGFDLPMARFSERQGRSFNFSPRNISQTAVGNPLLALRFRRPGSRFTGEFGARLPLLGIGDFSAASVGLFTDFYRIDAFAPKTLSILTAFTVHSENNLGIYSNVQMGGFLLVATGDARGSNENEDLYLRYRLGVGRASGPVDVSANLGGILLVTEGKLDIGQRTVHQFQVSANYTGGSFRPGLSLRMPVDNDLRQVVDAVFGLQLMVVFE